MFKSRISCLAGAIALVGTLAGCQTPGEENRADVYTSDQVNSAQGAQAVQIIAILPAKIQVDNSENQRAAQLMGGVLGAVGGGLLGGGLAHHNVLATGTIGALGGAGIGAASGSLVPGKVLVPGVSLTYQSPNGQLLNSAQVGQLCEYKVGRAILVQTSPTSTRIQPNAACPVAAQQT